MMPTRLPRALIAAVLLPLGLAACGVPDLISYTVKEVERSREQGRAQPARSEPQPAVARPAEEPPPPVAATGGAVPPRESVTVETLK